MLTTSFTFLVLLIVICWWTFVDMNRNWFNSGFNSCVGNLIWFMMLIGLTAVVAQSVFNAQVRR